MPNISVRTRGSIARFALDCGGDLHRFSISIDGTVSDSSHDPDEAAVMVALGGRPHACGCAIQAYKSALIAYKANLGLEDNPAARYRTRSGWVSGDQACDACYAYGNTIAHVNSVEHQLASQGLAEFIPAATTLLRWMHRNGEASQVITARHQLREALPRGMRGTFTASDRRIALTPRFINAAVEITGPNFNNIEKLRRNGVKVQWLNRLVSDLSGPAKTKIAERGRFSGIVKARNVDARIVAKFLNAGIYDHIHTYARAHVRPEQVLAVYRETNGSKTLADFMEEGLSAPQALARLRVA